MTDTYEQIQDYVDRFVCITGDSYPQKITLGTSVVDELCKELEVPVYREKHGKTAMFMGMEVKEDVNDICNITIEGIGHKMSFVWEE